MRFFDVILVVAFIGVISARRHHGRPQGQRGSGLLCRLEAVGDAELRIPEQYRPNGACPDDSSCTIGPHITQHHGINIQLTFCDATDSQGNLLVFRNACRIELADGTVIERNSRRECTKGPMTGYDYNGQAATAYFPNGPPPAYRPKTHHESHESHESHEDHDDDSDETDLF